MNRERVKELLPIFEAYANGEDIQFMPNQYNPEEGHPGWSDLTKDERLTITFPCPDYSYRIKPSPREFWLTWEDEDPRKSCRWDTEEFSKSSVDHWDNYIKVREVIE